MHHFRIPARGDHADGTLSLQYYDFSARPSQGSPDGQADYARPNDGALGVHRLIGCGYCRSGFRESFTDLHSHDTFTSYVAEKVVQRKTYIQVNPLLAEREYLIATVQD